MWSFHARVGWKQANAREDNSQNGNHASSQVLPIRGTECPSEQEYSLKFLCTVVQCSEGDLV